MKIYTDKQIKDINIIIDSIRNKYKDLAIKYEALKNENEMLRAIINAPDINYPNTEGGQDAPETPLNFPDEY